MLAYQQLIIKRCPQLHLLQLERGKGKGGGGGRGQNVRGTDANARSYQGQPQQPDAGIDRILEFLESLDPPVYLDGQVRIKQFDDASFCDQKEGILKGKIKNFRLDKNSVIRLDGRLCVPDVDGLQMGNYGRSSQLQNCQKSYADVTCDLEFKEGDDVSLKVSLMRCIMRFDMKDKLSPRWMSGGEVWFDWVERSRNRMSKITLNKKVTEWICYILNKASTDNKNVLRRRRIKDQMAEYFGTRKFNAHGRYMNILSLKGKDRAVVILLEAFNVGWRDVAAKIGKFINDPSTMLLKAPYKNYDINYLYAKVVGDSKWQPHNYKKAEINLVVQTKPSTSDQDRDILRRRIIGTYDSKDAYPL
ncbi:hypothetical protein MTR67_012926 [Solanum verrucosum]|uniref:Uncharacterized protein n=1 Tax=Solanum verrucosum TaxID=315347 RepID=A0AAF0QFD0_SOLVR|nr:hypothetical protein MTR67_012926 [Solanum verrucosum]